MKNKILEIINEEIYLDSMLDVIGKVEASDILSQLMCDITMDLMTDVTTFTYAKRRMLKHGFDPVQIEKSIEKLKY